jgi:hypothetical protein
LRVNRDILITYPDAEDSHTGDLAIYTPTMEELANYTDSFPRMLRSVCFLENHLTAYNTTRIVSERDVNEHSFVAMLSDFFAYRKYAFYII